MDIEIKNIPLSSHEDVVPFADNLTEASKKLAGKKASLIANKADYLRCKKYLTDRNLINILAVQLQFENLERGKVLGDTSQELYNKFAYEQPIYKMYYAGLESQFLAAEYFAGGNIQSRKIVFAHPTECISLIKIIVDDDHNIKLVAFFRSSSNRMLAADFLGLYWVLGDFMDSEKFKNIKFKNKEIVMVITDYQHI